MRYNALINTKSKSTIGWKDKRPIRHFELLEYIKISYYEDTIDLIKILQKEINKKTITNILSNFSDNIISTDMKELLVKYIIDRRNKILKIYDLID